ncbi:hypothetical protein ACFWI1_00165 [Cellulosimicrobium cellulans]|uniref:hypothetical protein n=1 Tax=Cellulosimicrobium cellulans TaxID=1710 RepID=UPI003658328F
MTTFTHAVLSTTSRIDVVLPPVLTPGELAMFHHRVRTGDVACRRRGRGDPAAARVRGALLAAVEVRSGSRRRTPVPDRAESADTITARTLARAIEELASHTWDEPSQPLARQLVWCGIVAVRSAQRDRVQESVLALRDLASRH